MYIYIYYIYNSDMIRYLYIYVYIYIFKLLSTYLQGEFRINAVIRVCSPIILGAPPVFITCDTAVTPAMKTERQSP